jgi:hypothetical protein
MFKPASPISPTRSGKWWRFTRCVALLCMNLIMLMCSIDCALACS